MNKLFYILLVPFSILTATGLYLLGLRPILYFIICVAIGVLYGLFFDRVYNSLSGYYSNHCNKQPIKNLILK